MDIYRFFHPHFNPRLLNVPVRQQEILDLEQAISECRKSVQRLIQRNKKNPLKELKAEKITEILKTMNSLEDALVELREEHPGDSAGTLKQLILERFNCVGWQAWANHVEEHLRTQNITIKE